MRLAGTVSTGAVVSSTVTVKLPWLLLPEKSVTVQVTVVVPSAKRLPDGGEQLTCGVTKSLIGRPNVRKNSSEVNLFTRSN